MKSGSWSWILGGALAAFGLGMGAEACSSSTTTTTTTDSGAGGSGHSGSSGAGGTNAGGTSAGGSSASSGSTGSNKCYGAPLDKVFPEDGGSFYCPFSEVDGGNGKAVNCMSGTEHCCETATAGAGCQPLATPCATGDTDWQCEGTPDCESKPGTICCALGGTLTPQGPQPGCADGGGTLAGYTYVSGFTGASCVAPASCSTFELCSKTSECGAGTCTPIKPKGNNVGYCVGGMGSGASGGGGSSSSSGSGSTSGSKSSSSSHTGSGSSA